MTLNQITKVKGPGIHTQANIVSNSISLGGIATASNFKTGTTNVHNVGIEIAGINVLGADTPIGTGATIYDAGGAVFTGVVTATSFSGSVSGTADLASGLTGTPDIAVRNITGVGATFTGNVSIGGTLTYEDVTNIDSVGIVTARAGIHAKDDSTFYGATSGRNVFWDKSENSLEFGDYTYAKFGVDEDLTVWSNDTASAINNKTGELRILSGTNVRILKRSDAGLGFGAQVANFNIDGACDLWHNGTKRIETTSSGIDVTGAITADDLRTDNSQTFYLTSANDFRFRHTGGSEKLRITSAGKMGLGNDNPGGMLHINNTGQVDLMVGSTNAGGAYLILDGDSNGDGVGADYSYIAHDTGGDLTIGADNPAGNADVIVKVGNNAEAIRVKNTGKLGINYGSPSTIIHAIGNNTVGTSVTCRLQSHDTANATANIELVARRSDNTAQMCRIRAASGGTNNIDLQFHTNNTEKLRITSAGRLTLSDSEGIQLSAKTSTLYSADGTLSYYATDNGVYLNGAGANGWLRLQAAGSANDRTSINISGHSRTNGDEIYFKTNSVERLRITSDGQLLQGSSATDQGWAVFYRSGSGGADAGTAGQDGAGDKGVNIRADMGPTHTDLTGVDNYTLKLHNAAYAGAGIADPQGTIAKILFNTTTYNGWNAYAAIACDTQGVSGGRGDLVFLTASGTSIMSERLRIQTGGDIIVKTNNVALSGVGTLRINSGSTAGALNLDGGATNHGGEINLLGGSNGGRILFRTGQGSGQQTEKMRLNENGSLRIGDAVTHTYSAHSEGDDLVVGGAGWRGMTIYGTSGGVIQFADAADNRAGQIMYNHGDDSMDFRVNGNATKLKIMSGGNIKIGHNNTGGSSGGEDKLNIKGSGAQYIYIGSTDASGAGVYFDGDSNGDMSGSDYARITHNTDGYLQLDNWKSGCGHRWAIGGNTRLQMNEDGTLNFTGAVAGTLSYTFYNSTGNSGSDTRLLIRTYANQGADPYIKFDSGGSNMIVGQLYAGTTNNKLVLGVGESPSGGVSGIHIAGDGNTQVTNHINMTRASDPRIYAGSSVGLNIDGQSLYLNRHTNSSIAMAYGGGPVNITNTVNADTQLNIYKQSGVDTNQAILRLGYDSNNCVQIYRVRNDAKIYYNTTQNDAHHVFKTKNGNDALYITDRQTVHAAKFSPNVIRWGRAYGDNGWNAGGYYKFIIRYSTGNYSGNFHFCRMITQHDWGHADWEMRITRDYYSPTSNDKSVRRVWGYYADHGYQWNSDQEGNTWDPISRYTNLGPGGAHKIHESSRGGYYRDCYATDYSINIGTYTGVVLEITVYNPGGWIKDSATSVTDVYPASFTGQASQSAADSWSYGRGLWFNTRAGFLQHWGSGSTFGSNTLPGS